MLGRLVKDCDSTISRALVVRGAPRRVSPPLMGARLKSSRLRIGVDSPAAEGEAIDHVLGRFRPSEKPAIAEAVATAVEGVVLWVRRGIEACMNQYNG